MTSTQGTPWYQARKAPFEAFGILYYPLFAHRFDLEGAALDDTDMAWAITANTNLEGTGYTLSQVSILALAALHHRLSPLAADTGFLPVTESLTEQGVNPLADLQRLVPDVSATPMYPDFPSQVMAMDEATFRYHQALHYASTYGVEQVAGLCGFDVTVGEGWLPDVTSTAKTRSDEAIVQPKVLHVVLTIEDMYEVVEARLARATRMHPAEIQTTIEVLTDFANDEIVDFPKVAFHENMMEIIRVASEGNSTTLAHIAGGFAQHPGDLLKATLYIVKSREAGHLATRQKKGLCRAFERFSAMSIARNIVDAGKDERRAINYLSVARFAGPHLHEACELVWSGKVVSWAARMEQLWQAVEAAKAPTTTPAPEQHDPVLTTHKNPLPERLRNAFARLVRPTAPSEAMSAADEPSDTVADDALDQAWQALLAHYGTRPGMLFRSLARLMKHGCPDELLRPEVFLHAIDYALPTLVRTLTIMSEVAPRHRLAARGYASFQVTTSDATVDKRFCALLRELVLPRLRELNTPFKGKRVYLDTAGISLTGSILMPNDTGNTGTAWPPIGMAWDLPSDQTVRFFTFWDDRRTRVDVDLHFIGLMENGERVNIGWNSLYNTAGMVTSGDITTSHNSVEYLDANMGRAREEGVLLVVQKQHIYCGATRWGDISTCYSGALVVRDTDADVELYDARNLLFRDDLTGEGTRMDYAVVNFSGHYLRIMRGAKMPLGDVEFSLGDYLAALLEAQGATLVVDPKDADVRVCVGRSDDPAVVSLFDEGFYLG